jgi:hypothetical protein
MSKKAKKSQANALQLLDAADLAKAAGGKLIGGRTHQDQTISFDVSADDVYMHNPRGSNDRLSG